MSVFSEKKTGQSGSKLALAVFFSFSLHVLFFVAAFMLFSVVTPRVSIPPSYQVKLVGLPSELTAEPQAATAPAAPKHEEKPKKEPISPKTKKALAKQSKAPLKKGAMPELVQKQKKAVPEPVQPEAVPSKPAAGPSVPEHGVTKSGGTAEGVAVGTTSPEFKFPPYVAIVREKIEQNWNPPPSSKNAKAKVLFKILRSGRAEDPKLKESSGQFYFDQAAIRAILMSNPFPPLPEGFFRDYEEFSVDMMEKE
jgi:TonB family protein